MAPAMTSLCPLRYLVALVMTTSAPCPGPEIHRAREGRVHQKRQPEFLRDARHGRQVQHPHGGIDRRLDEHGPGVLLDRLAPDPGRRRADIGDGNPQPAEFLVEQLEGAAVDPAAGQRLSPGPSTARWASAVARPCRWTRKWRPRPSRRAYFLARLCWLGLLPYRVQQLPLGADRVHEGGRLHDRRDTGSFSRRAGRPCTAMVERPSRGRSRQAQRPVGPPAAWISRRSARTAARRRRAPRSRSARRPAASHRRRPVAGSSGRR